MAVSLPMPLEAPVIIAVFIVDILSFGVKYYSMMNYNIIEIVEKKFGL